VYSLASIYLKSSVILCVCVVLLNISSEEEGENACL